MSVCRARSLSLFGIEALPVEVEVDVSSGLPGFSIVGLPDAAVQEARERVRVAISILSRLKTSRELRGGPASHPLRHVALFTGVRRR
jgi:Subunit ChlI of Mg-chelatase